MVYSSIKKKKCKCKPDNTCKLYPSLGYAGYASTHAPQEIKDKVGTRRQVAKRNHNKRVALSAKIHKAAREVNQEDINSDNWFRIRMNSCKPVCENCGRMAYGIDKYPHLWKSCQAHLLPKRHFKSLQSHPLNGMVLGSGFSSMCFCHDDYDSSWSKAETMKIWSEVVRRFAILYPLIHPTEHQYIPEVLLKTVRQENMIKND